MLSFMWVLGDMTDNSPEEIPALLADLANVDEEGGVRWWLHR